MATKKLQVLGTLGGGTGAGLTDEQAAEIAANTEARHTHDNKGILDKLTESESGNLLFNGAEIVGSADGSSNMALKSKYYANDWETGVIQIGTYGYQSIEFEIFEQLPDNVVVYDIGFEYDGKIYTSSEATQEMLLGTDAAVHIYGKPTFTDTFGTSLVCTIVDNEFDDILYNDLQNGFGKLTGFVVYYMEITEDTDETGSNVGLTGYAKTEDIPTKTSQLENDSGFITKADIPTDESYELVGQTPLTLENGGNIKLVADGEATYSMVSPTVWNFDNAELTLSNVELTTDEGYYKFTVNKEAAKHTYCYAAFIISGLEVGRSYKFIFDTANRIYDAANHIWTGSLTAYSGTSNSGATVFAGKVLKNGNFEFTAPDTSIYVRYIVPMNNTPLLGWVAHFNKMYLNYADMSEELTEIYSKSGTFTDIETFKSIPSGVVITTDPTASVYRKAPTDKTLTQSDVPADAEVTGKEIAAVKGHLPLFGKTIVNFGDSIFGQAQPPNDVSTFLAKKTGATVYNCGFGGCRMSQHGTAEYNAFSMFNVANAVSSGDFTLQENAVASTEVTLSDAIKANFARLKTVDFSKVDIVTIAYSTNDWNGSVALDNEENLYDTTTIGGALRTSIETLLTAYPNARIFVLSTTWRFWHDENNVYTEDSDTRTNSIGLKLADYNAKLKEVAEEYNLPFIDNYNIGIGKFNRTQYFSATDGTHHQIEGRKLIAEHLAGALTSCISDGYTPVKGKDYFTDTDKAEIVDDVIAKMNEKAEITIHEKSGGYYRITGDLVDEPSISSKYTDVIPVTEGEKYSYTGYGASQGASILWYSDYSSEESFTLLSYEQYNDGGLTGNAQTVVVTVPTGAKYARFCSYSYGTPVLSVSLYEEEAEETSALAGKKIVYDGDSICAGGDGSKGYSKIIAEMTNSSYVNQAVGGARLITLKEGYSYHSVVDNLPNLPDGDLYCFNGGINDYWTEGVELGTYDYTNFTGELDTTTVCGALETIFRYALNNFVGKPICFVITHKIQSTAYVANTEGKTFKDYHDAMVDICHKYSIPYYDAFYESGLNGWNTAQNNTYLTANSEGTPDGCHPNVEGYKRYYVPQLISLFERIMPTDVTNIVDGWTDVDLTWNSGKYASCQSIGSTIQLFAADGASYAVIPVNAGEKYKIDARHDYYSNAWVTTDSNNLCIREDSGADKSYDTVQEEITIQSGETKLYISDFGGFNSLKKWF